MDNYRAIIAIVLCIAVYLGWNTLAEHMGWMPPTPVQQTAVVDDAASPNASKAATSGILLEDTAKTVPNFVPAEGRDVIVDTPYYTAVFHSGGGVLKEFSLKKYPTTLDDSAAPVQPVNLKSDVVSPLGLLLNGSPTWSTGQWKSDSSDLTLKAGEDGQIEFIGQVGDIGISRKFTFDADNYTFNEQVSLLPSNTSGTARLGFTVGAVPIGGEGNSHDQTRVAYYTDKQSFHEEASESTLESGLAVKEPLFWGGVMSNYFLVAGAPEDTDVNMKARLQDSVYRVAIEKSDLPLTPGVASTYGFSYYIGPKEKTHLEAAPNFIDAALDYGWFTIFSRPLVWLLKFFYGYVHNYGVAIILLTVMIKIIFWPLSSKSYKSMEKMKQLQPMIAKLREKYADDKEKLNAETMQLYKTYKVNPVGGCLPIVVQIPVFFGLYRALLYSIELRHSSFISDLPFTNIVWLADLSAKDPLYITPLLMGATMLFQQWITPSSGDPTQAKIMMIMPIVFTFIFMDFPSGLVLYWLVNNVISIGQQWFMLRKVKTT